MKPVYMINGFLESGKTEFITFTLQQPYFKTQGKTLLIVCEEGENEYEEAVLKKNGTVLEMIEEEEEFTPQHLIELEKKHKPERIIIEYNGMWNYKNMKLPWYWKIEQQITIIVNGLALFRADQEWSNLFSDNRFGIRESIRIQQTNQPQKRLSFAIMRCC